MRRPLIDVPRGIEAAVIAVFLLLGSACTDDDLGLEAAERRMQTAEEAAAEAAATLEQAGLAFCVEAKDYVVAIDRYGKVFGDAAATVGDVRTLGADLVEPKDSTVAAAQAVLDAHDAVTAANEELADARAALKEANASASGKPEKTVTPSPVDPSTPSVPPASIERVEAAEAAFEATSQSVTDDTPVVQAAETFTSAAFALEAAWLNLFVDAGCLTDQQSKDVAGAVRGYTTALQTDLATAGYFTGQVDGVYGPETVAAVEQLQSDAGLPTTGLVDRATRAALDEAVATEGQSAAAGSMVEAAAVQTILKIAGYWPGAIDGEWTPELDDALKRFQKDLGVEPTGALDAATLTAMEAALVELTTPTAAPTVSAEPSSSSSPS